MKVKKLIKWLKKYDDDTDIFVVNVKSTKEYISPNYEPLNTSFTDGNVEAGFHEDSKYLVLGAIEIAMEEEEEAPKIIKPESKIIH